MNTFEEEVALAAEALKSGKTILYPTDTIWGIGCDATNQKSVNKVYKLKQRKENKSLIVLLESTDKLKDFMDEVPAMAFDLINASNNPLTIVYPGARNLAKNLVASDRTIAIRVTADPFCVALLKAFGRPIVSTSANISGEPTAISYSQISSAIKNGVDHIVNQEQTVVKQMKASTIIKLEINGTFLILRS
ncbi:MAG: threonylcarbamoyl-AMP synthase [Bacteroidetes bacterium]|nr:threonylcarbamoyl-AMP synthase [Bacteroidales bacterium]MBU1011240.1 threonylcarbamoyl-AMP synthase [Bacteroidota bacterium]